MAFTVLAVGDVVAESGLRLVQKRLRSCIRETGADFTVLNGENVSGTGVTAQQAQALLEAGADVVTLGNHAFRRDGIGRLLDEEPRLLRPANLSPVLPGRGWGVYDTRRGSVLVMNLIGRCNMDYGPDNPFLEVERILKQAGARFRLLDFHAEASSEKQAMGWLLDGRVSAVWGTHTHVQTSDACVLPQGTGYITDLGMSGPLHSVLGMLPELSVRSFQGYPHGRYEAAPGPCRIEGAVFTLDERSGRCLKAEALRIHE